MTYTAGGLIEATDFNGFVSTSGANINGVWGSGSTSSGWGQTPLSTVSAGATVSATNWASLVNTLSAMGSQTGTTITSRSAPTAGSTISTFAAINTDITNVTTNRGNAAASGTTSSTWGGNVAYTANQGAVSSGWTLTWTQTVSFSNADSARYFWNAGGLIRLDMSKTSTGTDHDPDWNTLVGQVGTLYISGRVNGAAQTIAGVSYTGTTRIGGTGGTQTALATTTGWYSLTAGAAATTLFQLNDAISPYSGNYIRVTAAIDSGASTLTLTTTWVDAGYSGAGKTNNITGGTDTTSPFTSFGTAPAVLCRYVPPSTSYLTATWGTPLVSSTVGSNSRSIQYLVVASGGGGGGGSGYDGSGGGGGAGGLLTGTTVLGPGSTVTVTVGPSVGQASSGSNSVFSNATALGGGAGGQNSAGGNGGSGGGGSTAFPGSSPGGSGTPGQGYSGSSKVPTGGAGSGGGASESAPSNGPSSSGGAGSFISWATGYGSPGGYFGGGGTGGAQGTGGIGGGGSGPGGSSGSPGTPNTGGGGGGGHNNPGGGSGGSGIVIIRYVDSYGNLSAISGGLTYTLTTAGGYKTYAFTAGTGTITL